MTNANDQAFSNTENHESYSGLTKREYFAALAIQGILANQTYDNWDNYDIMAKDACNAADALIAELNKQL